MRPAPTLSMLALGLAVVSCGKRDFDERYAERQKELASEAASMNGELEKRITEKPGMETLAPMTAVTSPEPAK